MNCAEKPPEPTIPPNLHTKPPKNPSSENPWYKRDSSQTLNPDTKPQHRPQKPEKVLRSLRNRQPCLRSLSQQFIANVEVSNMVRCSSKTNELRDTDPTGRRARTLPLKNEKLTISKSKSSRLSQTLAETTSLEIDKLDAKR